MAAVALPDIPNDFSAHAAPSFSALPIHGVEFNIDFAAFGELGRRVNLNAALTQI